MSAAAFRTAILATITMIAFACNSIFGRLALSSEAIDPASYTTIRLISGAMMLLLIVSLRGGFRGHAPDGSFLGTTGLSALALFGYAAFFSFAYLSVDTGVGALILFACVQGTMILWGVYKGERPDMQQWVGMTLAFAGFVYLVSPGLAAPDALGSVLMGIAGISWGIYSLRGRGQKDPVQATARNFIATVPLCIVLSILLIDRSAIELPGVILAVTSGAVTSALGYSLWYETIKGLSATKSAIIQLTVPVIATAGGALFLGEPVSLRYVLASILILGGVALTVIAKQKAATK
ncbi:MAG: DMT family transporter [Rhizobiales bacterium]|nr:DMT family transporter [Hyphomicrobiales bacterium]